MKKTIILSIKPVFSDEIYSGKKLVELRRSIGLLFKEDTPIFIYSTTPSKAITGYAEILKVEKSSVEHILKYHLDNACIDLESCSSYFYGRTFGYLIWLKNVRRFSNPLNLSELKKIGFTAPQSFTYATDDLIQMVENLCQ
jgi:predicted transcriptional regulator